MKDLFLQIQQRILAEVPEVKWVDQDLGQLEFYNERPAVLFPCVLIDFDDIRYSDMASPAQMAEGTVKLRVAFNVVHHSAGVTPTPQRDKAMEIWDVIAKLNKNLHGWSGTTFSQLTRLQQQAEPREDTLRVYVLSYSVAFEEYNDAETTEAARPPMEMTTQ